MTTSLVEGRSPSDVDLRRAPLASLRAIDLRAPDRDLWADERALWDRFTASWAGLDDAAWRLAGAAPSDAGGPDWSLLDHIGHVAYWQELAIDYVTKAEATGVWPTDEEFDGGDFDRYNERHRTPWDRLEPAELRRRLHDSHGQLLVIAHRLSLDTIRGDDGWGWVYMTLHGHTLDHLGVIEPWADRLRDRQAQHDPFVTDPRPASGDDEADIATFWAAEEAIDAQFDELVRAVPIERWTIDELTEGWTLRDHVAHLADWFEEGAAAVETHARTGIWPDGPEEGFDAWNERALERLRALDRRTSSLATTSSRQRMRAAVRTMPAAVLRSVDGWSWVYECLYGHVRSHLAMVGPWCARIDWPPAAEEG